MSETGEAVGRVRGTLDSGDRMGGFHASDDTGNTVRRGDLRTLLAALARVTEELSAARHELALSESMRTQALDDLAFADERALTTLRERLAGEVGALKQEVPLMPNDVDYTWRCPRCRSGVRTCNCDITVPDHNAAIDRAVAVIRGEAT